MKIELVRWKSEGLRTPDLTVDLMTVSKPARVTLLQMPNGTGKTTTLELLKATLTGSARSWGSEEVLEQRRPGEKNSKGSFRVELRADGKPVTFELTFDFDEGTARYHTTSPLTGGVVHDWEPPSGLRRFLSEEFIRLFIFDGEFADRLLNRSDNEAERAIDALCQLYLVDEVSEIASKDWDAKVKGGGGSSSGALATATSKLQAINKQIGKVSKAQAIARKKMEDGNAKLIELDDKIKKHIANNTDLREQHEAAVNNRAAAQSILDQKLAETMEQMRFPNAFHSAFGEALTALKGNLDRLKLPETSSRQFFQELSEEAICVCGRPLDAEHRQQIMIRSKLYLGQEEAGSINALKKDIDTYCDGGGNNSVNQLAFSSKDMVGAMKAVQMADQAVRTLKQSLIRSGDAELKKLQDDHDTLEEELAEVDDALKEIEGTATGDEDPTQTNCLKALQSAKKDQEGRVAKISGTLTLKAQTDAVRQIAERAKELARNSIREAVRTKANKMLQDVLANDPIEILSIARSLNIKNQRGASVGQTLSVGYAFLMSLLERGNNQFPLVVDSPSGALGGGRREAVGRLIPQLCSQFVALMIDVERAEFVPAIEKVAKADIRYLTAFRNTAEAGKFQESLPKSGVTKTATGTLVEGREYFNLFKE